MRQVPQYLIIGDGRVAKHFQYFFTLKQYPHSIWHRRLDLSILHEQLKKSTHVLLLIADKAIAPFIEAHLKKQTTAYLIHCSGSLHLSAAYGAHPLMSFSHHLYEKEVYESIPFVVDDDAPPWEKLFPGFTNPHAYIQPAQKAKYHAYCVMSGNFTCILWQRFFHMLTEEFYLPAEISHAYLRRVTENLIQHPNSALTGPLVRGDDKTIQNHLSVLAGDPFRALYQQFVTTYQQLTNERTQGK